MALTLQLKLHDTSIISDLLIFLSLTISGGDLKERWIGDAYEHESYTDYNASMCLDGGTTTEGDLNSTHLSFCCPACKLQVSGRYVSTTSEFSLANLYLGL